MNVKKITDIKFPFNRDGRGEEYPRWKPDCQGKKDYDADLLRLSCRSYPRGGGFDVFKTTPEGLRTEPKDKSIRPSAYAHLMFGDSTIAQVYVERDTEEEVHRAVETWASATVACLQVLLLNLHGAVEALSTKCPSCPGVRPVSGVCDTCGNAGRIL